MKIPVTSKYLPSSRSLRAFFILFLGFHPMALLFTAALETHWYISRTPKQTYVQHIIIIIIIINIITHIHLLTIATDIMYHVILHGN